MGRPSKYDWGEIEKAFTCGMERDRICKKYGVSRKTLDNKIALCKWEVSGEVKSAIDGAAMSIGVVSGIMDENPEIAPIIQEEVESKTRGRALFDDVNNLIMKQTKKLAGKAKTMTELYAGARTVRETGMNLGYIDRFATAVNINNNNDHTQVVGFKAEIIE